jgi:hypothetical protein
LKNSERHNWNGANSLTLDLSGKYLPKISPEAADSQPPPDFHQKLSFDP